MTYFRDSNGFTGRSIQLQLSFYKSTVRIRNHSETNHHDNNCAYVRLRDDILILISHSV